LLLYAYFSNAIALECLNGTTVPPNGQATSPRSNLFLLQFQVHFGVQTLGLFRRPIASPKYRQNTRRWHVRMPPPTAMPICGFSFVFQFLSFIFFVLHFLTKRS